MWSTSWLIPLSRWFPIVHFKLAARKKFAEVELCGGLVEITDFSFGWYIYSIKKITIPHSLRRICDHAFCDSLWCPVCLHDGIESIAGRERSIPLLHLRQLLNSTPHHCESRRHIEKTCKSMFSLEIPKVVKEIERGAFSSCLCQRNVAFPLSSHSHLPMLITLMTPYFL